MGETPYFIWKDIDSRSMGVKVLAYPPRIHPKERVEYVAIPGKAGDLAIKEGRHIYDAYTRPMELRNSCGFDIEKVRKWLTGQGKMVYGCEPDRAYQVDLSAVQQYDYFSRGIWICTLQMRTQPLKERLYSIAETLDAAGTVHNGGDVEAYPVIIATPGLGATTMTVTVDDKTLTISNVTGAVRIDSDAKEVTDVSRTELLTLNSGGPFPVLAVGDNAISGSGWVSLEIYKNERFL